MWLLPTLLRCRECIKLHHPRKINCMFNTIICLFFSSSIDIKPTSGIVDAGGSLTLEISVNNTEESNVFEMVNVTGEVHFWQLNDVKNISKMNVEGTPEEKLQFYITFTGDETVNDDVYMVL